MRSIAIVFGAQWMRSPGTLSTQIPTTGSAVGKVVPLETAREIQISSKPAGALLIEFESRQELGITPMKVEVLTGKTRKLEVQAKGHQTKIIELDDSSKATHLVLVPNKPVAPKVAPRPKPAAVKRSAPVKKVIKSPPKPAPRRKPIRAAPSPAKKPPPKVYKPPKKKKPAPAMKKGEVPKWSDW